jgi:hypothetical protein
MSFRRACGFHFSTAEMYAVRCFTSFGKSPEKHRSRERGVAERREFPPPSGVGIHHFHCRRFLKSLCQPANNVRVAASEPRAVHCSAFLVPNGSLHGAMVQHGVGPNR